MRQDGKMSLSEPDRKSGFGSILLFENCFKKMLETAGKKHLTDVNTISCVSHNRLGHAWDTAGTAGTTGRSAVESI